MKTYLLHFGLIIIESSLALSMNQADWLIINFYSGSHIAGLYAFVCENDDFSLINLSYDNHLNVSTNIVVLSDSNMKGVSINNLKTDIELTGVYIDLTCKNGVNFIKESALNRILFKNNHKWLLKSNSYEASTSLLNEIQLSVDSDVSLAVPENEELHVYEVFKMHETLPIESWLTGRLVSNMEYTRTGIQLKREDFQGFKMNVTFLMLQINLKPDEPIEMLLDSFFYPESARISRFSYPLFIHFSEILNITYNYHIVGEWGVEQTPGNWSGMLGVLQRGDCEFGLQVSKVRHDRLDVVDIHHTYKELKVLFLFLQPRTFGSYKALVAPFSRIVWICFGLLCLVLPFIYWMIAQYDTSDDLNSWSAIFIYLAGAIAQQGFPESAYGLTSTKVASSFLLVYAFMLCLYYNAAVLNGLLSPSPPSITSLDNLLDSNLQLGVLDLPYLRDFHSEESFFGPHDALTKRMFEKMFKYDRLFFGLEEGLKRVRKEKFAFFVDDGPSLPLVRKTFSEAEICSTYAIYKPPRIDAGLTLKKNSPYKELMSQKFTWMREVGLLKRNLEVWYPGMPKCNWRQEAIPIGVEAVTVAFIVLIFGCIFSALILIAERYVNQNAFSKFNIF